MTIKSLTELKTYFELGDRPTEQQFEFLIDSFSVSSIGYQENIVPINQILCDSAIKIISSSGGSGNIFLISDPQIAQGVDGQKLILMGKNDSDIITLENNRGLQLIRNFECTSTSTIYLVYVHSKFKWVEVSRRDSLSDGTLLTVNDEGISLSSSVTSLNFIGANVSASNSIPGQVDIVVSGVSPDYVSHFNTSDGETNATINDFAVSSRNIASPVSEGLPYNIGSWIAGSQYNCINNSIISYSNIESFSILNNIDNTLTVNVYDANDTTILATHQVILTGNIDITLNNIRIQILNFTSDFTQYKADTIISININNIISTGGRFSIEIINDTITNGTFVKTQGPIFYDPNSNLSVLSGLSIVETPAMIVTKNISGVIYYTIGSNFTVNIADIDYLNDRSYPNTQIQIVGIEYGLPQLNLTGSDLTNWNNLYNDINDSYNKTNWEITSINFFTQSISANISSRAIDWINHGYINSTNTNILIDTYSNNNTGVFQDFRNEINRYQSDLVTSWNSSTNLSLIDSGNGLQLKNSQLIYPTEDFTIYNPTLGSQPDYSLSSGTKIYYSEFIHNGISHSNGRFQFGDYNITETNITNNDCIIEISLNGIDWFILNLLYPGGVISDGQGCRVNNGSYNLSLNNQIEFTFGTGKFTDATSGSSGWGLWYRISYADNVDGRNLNIGSFEIINWV